MTYLPLYLLGLLVTFYVWLVVSRVVHEVVRGIAARLVGYAPRTVTIGIGEVWWSHRVGRTWVEWTPAPLFSQATLHMPSQLGLTWRWSTCILAAVAMDISLLTAMMTARDALHTAYPVLPLWTVPILCLPYAQLLVTVLNLMPVEIHGESKQDPVFYSDGNLLLALLWGRFADVPGLMVERYVKSVQAYDPAFQKQDSPILTHMPSTIWRRFLEVHLDEASGDYDSVVWHCKRLLHTVDFAPGERARLLDTIASIPVYHPAPGLLHRALRLGSQAHALFPQSAKLQMTLGCLLVQQGRLPEGLALLEPVAELERLTKADQAICASHLAVAHHQLGDLLETKYWLTSADEKATNPKTKAAVDRLCAKERTFVAQG